MKKKSYLKRKALASYRFKKGDLKCSYLLSYLDNFKHNLNCFFFILQNDSSSFSAFSARSNLNKYHLQANLNPSQPPNFPSLLNPAMMAAQIGLLNSPNTLMAMMQVSRKFNF